MQQKRYSSDLTARQWQRIAPLFVVRRTSKWPLEAIGNGVFYVLKNGCVWRAVPADLLPWVTVYYYFTKWSVLHEVERGWHLGAGERLSEQCRAATRKKSVQPTAVILDSQSVKHSATNTARLGYDAGKRSKGRKRFFLVDTLGNLLASCVVAANCRDGTTAAQVWDAWALRNELLDRAQTVFVDGGFGQRFRQQLAQRGSQGHVPTGVLVRKGRFFPCQALGSGAQHCLGGQQSAFSQGLRTQNDSC